MNNFILFALDPEITASFEKYFGQYDNFTIMTADVRDLVRDKKLNIAVSPANMYGFMDGGIDLVYMDLFDGIEETVMNKIKSYQIYDWLERYVVPLGSAFMVETGNENCPYLISAATMRMPDPINGTRNVYYCFRAILNCVKTFDKERVIGVPALGTGFGELTGEECAAQMHEAYLDFIHNENVVDPSQIRIDESGEYILKKMPDGDPHGFIPDRNKYGRYGFHYG